MATISQVRPNTAVLYKVERESVVEIVADEDFGHGPTRGPSWTVRLLHPTPRSVTRSAGKQGPTLYQGHDLDKAVRCYERHSGQRLADAERAQLSREAEEYARRCR